MQAQRHGARQYHLHTSKVARTCKLAATLARTVSAPRSTSFKKRSATLSRLASGHGWNQSITVELIVARKRWLRILKLSPTGDAVNTMCRFCLTLPMNVAQQLSLVSGRPLALVSERIALMMSSLSSTGKRSGISPEERRSLMKTSIFSSTTCNVCAQSCAWFVHATT